LFARQKRAHLFAESTFQTPTLTFGRPYCVVSSSSMVRLDTLQAVILTGARDVHNSLLAGTGLHSKVLLPVGGKPMVLSVLEALVGSRYRPALYISTDDPELQALPTSVPFQTLPSGDRAVGSLLKALELLPGQEWVLFVSGDHPLLTPEMIDYFIEQTLCQDLTFSVAVVARDVVNRAYPQSRRTYFEAKGGAYSGGNLILVNKRRFQGDAAFMETVDRNRKHPMRSVFLLDPLTMLLVLLRCLDIHEMARRASKAFGCNAGIVEMPFAECCMDVDKPSDLEIADMILAKRGEESLQGKRSSGESDLDGLSGNEETASRPQRASDG
jgi:GTP:adenosylcobinamide-phosphate guanylyltransferase